MAEDDTIKTKHTNINTGDAQPPVETSPAKVKPKLTKFRAHFRKSSDNERRTMDVEAKDIGDVHDAVRKAHQTDEVRVFIDKVKVLGE